MMVFMLVLDIKIDIELDQCFWVWQKENLFLYMQDWNIVIVMIWFYLIIYSLINLLQGLAIVFVFIFFVMLLMLWLLCYGVISLVFNIILVMFGFGVWYFYFGWVGLGLICVIIIIIGIVVDDIVYFLVKY